MTENEILRATTGSRATNASTSLSALRGFFSAPDQSSDEGGSNGDAIGGAADVKSGAAANVDGGGEGGGAAAKGKGDGIILTSNALWDYIVEHPLVKGGQIDISDACDRLRRLAKPGRNGPVFAEEDVLRAIEGSRRGGGDALI